MLNGQNSCGYLNRTRSYLTGASNAIMQAPILDMGSLYHGILMGIHYSHGYSVISESSVASYFCTTYVPFSFLN
jgi:hypothetical protein